jgi:hypothetical protein
MDFFTFIYLLFFPGFTIRQENKIMKSMEIATFKVKSRHLPVLTFGHSDLNILSYRSPLDAKSIVLDI